MLTPEQFRETNPPEELSQQLPDGPIDSLRELQYLYGVLAARATDIRGKASEYAEYLSPGEGDDLIGEEDSLIVIKVDLSDRDNPKLADHPLEFGTYTEDYKSKIAHSRYSHGRGMDYSITHRSGNSSSHSRMLDYVTNRLSRWPSADAISALAEDHEDGWIINALAELGDSEDTIESITDAFKTRYDEDEGESPAPALITVRVKTEPSGKYHWPGELDVFYEALIAQVEKKQVSKNKASDSSGIAADMVTNDTTEVIGTYDDFGSNFRGKQQKHAPNFDPNEFWRSHPVSKETAVTLGRAEDFIELCTYSQYRSDAEIAYCPYFIGEHGPEEAYALYELLYTVATADNDRTPLARLGADELPDTADPNRLRFYVTAKKFQDRSRYDHIGEQSHAIRHTPRELARRHNRLCKLSTVFSDHQSSDRTPPLSTGGHPLLYQSDDRLHDISTSWYFHLCFPDYVRKKRDSEDNVYPTDARIHATLNVIGGQPVSVEELLDEYVQAIVIAQNDEDDDSMYEGFPAPLVSAQFTQLCALADSKLGLLTTSDSTKESITKHPTYTEHPPDMPDDQETQAATDGGSTTADDKLASFISQTPALISDEPADVPTPEDERRAAFLLGALIGAVGSYQEYSEGRTTTVITEFGVDSISTNTVKDATERALKKTITYTTVEKRNGQGFAGTKYEHIVERLRKAITMRDPEDWEIDDTDLRFYYALGVTYGMNDRPSNRNENETSDNTEA
jgi:CRISPR-associated protein Cas8b/Csh1 subtype I-B